MPRRPPTNTPPADLPDPDPATTYARAVVAGDTVAGPLVRAACARHLHDLTHAPARGYTWHPDRAAPVYRFFAGVLRHYRPPFEGRPFDLLPWQQFVVGSLYGWRRADTGRWRFRRAYIETGKGSGKTPMVAGILLHRVWAEGDRYTEAVILGRHAEQARVTFEVAAEFVEASPRLKHAAEIVGGVNPYTLLFPRLHSRIRRVGKTVAGKGQSGPILTVVVADEYHEHDDADALGIYESGFKIAKNPVTLITTNSGRDELGPCWSEHEHASRVVTQTTPDDTLFAYITSLDEPERDRTTPHWWGVNEACWPKTNPSLDAGTPSWDYLRAEATKAQHLTAARLRTGRLNFCIWGGDTGDAWISREAWLACESTDPAPADLADAECYLGIDLSQRTDLSAMAAIWIRPDGRLYGRIRALTPQGGLTDRSDRDRAPYPEWVADGYLETCEGDYIRPRIIAGWVRDHLVAYPRTRALGYDRWRFDQLVLALEEFEIETTYRPQGDGLILCPHEQGTRPGDPANKEKVFDQQAGQRPVILFMPRSIDALESSILQGQLTLEYSPLLRWAALTAKVGWDFTGTQRCWRKKDAKSRIDPLVALTMATGCAIEFEKSLASRANPFLGLLAPRK